MSGDRAHAHALADAPGSAAAPRAVRAALAALLLVAAIAATYRSSFDGGFVSDDRPAILHNPLLRSLDTENLRAIFSSFDDANYIPLKVLSLAVDQQIWGPEPFGYHLGNLLLHILCAVFIWRILLFCGLSESAALLVALLWGVHPVQVESVAFMSERKNVLSGAAFFAAFLAYLHFSASGRWRTWALVLALFVVALLSKMNTVVLPALGLAYEVLVARYRPDAAPNAAGRARRTVLASLPLFAVGAFVVWYNLAGNRMHGSNFHGGSALATWLTSTTVVFRYLGAVLWPAHLRSYYYIPLHGSPLDAPVALAILGLAVLAAVTLWLAAYRRIEAFWLVWFVVTLGPMLNIVPFPTLMQDRYLYLPLVGLLAVPAFALDGALRRPWMRRLAAAATAVAIIALAAVTERRIAVWHDELSLWSDWAVQDWYLPVDQGPLRNPDSDRRLVVLEEAARLAPEDLVIRHNLGALLYERHDLARARIELEAAQALGGDRYAMPLLNLGRTYLYGGDPPRAVAVLRRSIELEPYAFYSQLNLARAAMTVGDLDTAAAALDAAAAIRPGMGHLLEDDQTRLRQLRER